MIVDGHYATEGMILPDKQTFGALRLDFAGIRKHRHIRFGDREARLMRRWHGLRAIPGSRRCGRCLRTCWAG